MKDRDLKHRIGGASETVKITRAMQLVSASKMAKAEKKLVCGRDFLLETEKVVRRIGADDLAVTEKREVRQTAYVVVTGDKGLCGDYNHKVLEYAEEKIVRTQGDVVVYPVGQFGREYFTKGKYKVKNKFAYLLQSSFAEDIRNFAYDLKKAFVENMYDEIYLIYTKVNEKQPSHQERDCLRLFPVETPERETEESYLEYQNEAEAVLMQYVWARIAYAIASSEYAVNFKCMTAMQQATTNGEELVESLRREYNHVRQEKITGELLDSRQDFGKR